MTRLFIFFVTISFVFNQSLKASEESSKVFHYYCTAADEDYFPILMGLIGSIHKVDFDSLDEIAVFDLGLNPKQKEIIENIEKTKLYQVEKVNPEILKYFKTNPSGKLVRGWYAWKPAILKQASEMFPYFLYMDAGNLVLRSPNNLFKHIKQNGYFLMSISPHFIEERITKPVIEKIVSNYPKNLQEVILKKDTYMIDGGFQGISKKLYQNYIFPLYKLAKDLSLFADDGSAPLGFGSGRHDQTLCSIFAHVKKFNLNSQGWSNLKIDEKEVPFHIHYNQNELNEQSIIYRSRSDYNYGGNKMRFIHWKHPKLLTENNKAGL